MGKTNVINGCRSAKDTATATQHFPSNGIGGNTATNTASHLKGSTAHTIYGVTIDAVGAGTITLTLKDYGNTALTHLNPIVIPTTAVAPWYIPIGGPNGLQVDAADGFSWTCGGTDAAFKFTIWYDRTD